MSKIQFLRKKTRFWGKKVRKKKFPAGATQGNQGIGFWARDPGNWPLQTQGISLNSLGVPTSVVILFLQKICNWVKWYVTFPLENREIQIHNTLLNLSHHTTTTQDQAQKQNSVAIAVILNFSVLFVYIYDRSENCGAWCYNVRSNLVRKKKHVHCATWWNNEGSLWFQALVGLFAKNLIDFHNRKSIRNMMFPFSRLSSFTSFVFWLFGWLFSCDNCTIETQIRLEGLRRGTFKNMSFSKNDAFNTKFWIVFISKLFLFLSLGYGDFRLPLRTD